MSSSLLRAVARAESSHLFRQSHRSISSSVARRGGHGEGGHGAGHGHGAESHEMASYMATKPKFLGGLTPITGVDYSYIFVWVGMFTVMYLARNVVPNTSLKDWANDEAAERLRRRELGLDVKFGTNYATLRALGQEPDDSEE